MNLVLSECKALIQHDSILLPPIQETGSWVLGSGKTLLRTEVAVAYKLYTSSKPRGLADAFLASRIACSCSIHLQARNPVCVERLDGKGK